MKEEKKLIPLTNMSAGEVGIVAEIRGGLGAARRLEALGLRVGVKLTKISDQFLRGPVIIQVGQTTLAVGHGLANKVIVEVKE